MIAASVLLLLTGRSGDVTISVHNAIRGRGKERSAPDRVNKWRCPLLSGNEVERVASE